MASTTTKLWTLDEFRALPEDGRRYELIAGVLYVNGVEVPGGDIGALAGLVTPAPTWRHGAAVEALFLRLHAYLASVSGVGFAAFAPHDVELGESIVQPDLFVVPPVDGRRPREWAEVGRLLLAVEVVSPSSARQDRVGKRRLYQQAGVPEYWIVDLDARTVERWRPGDERPEILAEELVWRADPARAAMTIDLVRFFSEIGD